MIDFSSALYLGMKHPSETLRPWSQFTTGIPAALGSPPSAEAAASRVASLQGCRRGLLGSSTLHLFWDLFGILAEERVNIFLDASVYPIARWGAERASARGVPVQTIQHHDTDILIRLARNGARRGLRPVMVTDGYCPGCGKAAPLAEFLDALRRFGGLMIVDDTQAFGIFGRSPSPNAPYGLGGGGILPWSNCSAPDVLAISSLAKGFGVPIAIICGSDRLVRRFEAKSKTLVHCSPPSIAAIHATEQALNINETHGDSLRLRLVNLVLHFRQQMAKAGLRFSGGLFPIQTLTTALLVDVGLLYNRLVVAGIKPVLHRNRDNNRRCLSFIITSRHTCAEIDFTVEAIVSCQDQGGLWAFEPSGKRTEA